MNNPFGVISIHSIEECSELIQALTKIQRFGLDSVNPYENISNKEALLKEIGDVHACLALLEQSLLEIDPDSAKKISAQMQKKILKVHNNIQDVMKK